MQDSTCSLQSTELQHCHSYIWPAGTYRLRRLQERRQLFFKPQRFNSNGLDSAQSRKGAGVES